MVDMIRSIEIENFKSIVRQEIVLGRVNIFIGANGSGKSNLLEAVGVLSAAASGRVDDEALLRRGVRPGLPRLYKTAFPLPKADQRQHIKFSATTDSGAVYTVTLWNPVQNPDPAWRFKTETLSTSERSWVSRSTTSAGKHNQEHGLAALEAVRIPPKDGAAILLEQLRYFGIYCPNTPSLRGLTPDMQSREPIGLAGGRLPEAVGELIQQRAESGQLAESLESVLSLIDWASDFAMVPSSAVPLSPSAARTRNVTQFTDKYMTKKEKKNRLSGYDASEGALYVLFCAVLALHPKAPKFLAIDNVDQALNPRLATRLVREICSWTETYGNRQWILTCHNPATLDGIPFDAPGIKLFAVDRNSKGHTSLHELELATLKQKRPGPDWTLSRMWVGGYIGGVPDA